MNPKVKQVTPVKNNQLRLVFENGEERLFNVRPYMIHFFSELEDEAYFRRVRLNRGSVEWPHGQSLSYDTLYLDSRKSEPETVVSSE